MHVKLGTALALSAVIAVTASTATVTAANLIGAPQSAQVASATPDPARPNAAPPAGSTNAVGTAGTELVYVPITPCRIADTRAAGGKLGANSQRSFVVKGTTGFTAQGGHGGGCGIPNSAATVQFSFTTTDSSGYGRLTAWAHGQTEPAARVLAFDKNKVSIANATVPVALTGSPHLRLHAYDKSTHVVIDAVGYFAPQMAAYILSSGTISDSTSRLVSSTKTGTGTYTLIWDRDVTPCAVNVNADFSAKYASTYTSGTATYVYMFDSAGSPVDYWFNINVTC